MKSCIGNHGSAHTFSIPGPHLCRLILIVLLFVTMIGWPEVSRSVTGDTSSVEYRSHPQAITSAYGQVSDPTGDAIVFNMVPISPDLVSASVTTNAGSMRLSVRFAPGTFNRQTTSVQFGLDTDQNPNTGHPGVDNLGIRDAGIIGLNYIVNLNARTNNAQVFKYTGPPINTFTFVSFLPLTSLRDGMETVVPLSNIGGDDGRLNFKVLSTAAIGNNSFSTILDIMPDVGKGVGTTIGTFPAQSCINDVTAQFSVRRSGLDWVPFSRFLYSQTITVRNTSSQPVAIPLFVVLDNLRTATGDPVFLLGDQLQTFCNRPKGSYLLLLTGASGNQVLPGQTVGTNVVFVTQGFGGITYTPHVISGMPSQ